MSLRNSYFSIIKAYVQTCPILLWSDLQTDLAYVNSSSESVSVTNHKHSNPNHLTLYFIVVAMELSGISERECIIKTVCPLNNKNILHGN